MDSRDGSGRGRMASAHKGAGTGLRPAARLRRALGVRDLLSAGAAVAGHLLLRRGAAPGRGLVSEESPVIIAGMHRSGTSLVARLLERGGMYVGGSWVDENHESIHFTRANRAMVGEGSYLLQDYGWTAPKTDDFIQARRGYAERAVASMSVFFAERNGEAVWGWKDPRNCLTLPVWLSIYPAARVLHIVRDGRSVALSLTDRDGLHPAFGLALWAHYLSRVELTLEAVPESGKLTVRFEDLTEAPAATLAKLYEFANLDPSASLGAVTADIDAKRATARLDDPRIADMGDHPMLARYGYC